MYEPSPRFGAHSSPVEGKLYLWGGRTKDNKDKKISSVEVWDPLVEKWLQHTTAGSLPPWMNDGASTSIGSCMYSYGGYGGSSRLNSLYQLDTNGLGFTLMNSNNPENGPMKKSGCGMVSYNRCLVIFGGGGDAPTQPQPGSSYFNRGTNELHTFDLLEETWSSPPVTGTRPPPCGDFSFILIDSNHAVLFGGWQPGLGKSVNDLYLLDLAKMHWDKIPSNGDSCPVRRYYHACAIIGYGGDHPQLLVTGGIDTNGAVLKDAWMLDLHSWKWREVKVADQQSRWSHTACAFNITPLITEVILFGGCTKFDYSSQISNTTVLRFESKECPTTDGTPPTKEWILTNVADKKNIGTAQRIEEKVRKITEQTQKSGARIVAAIGGEERGVVEERVLISEKRLEEAEERRRQAEVRAKDAEKRVRELDERLKGLSLKTTPLHITQLDSHQTQICESVPDLPKMISLSLTDGSKLNLTQQIGTKYSSFGILLLNDQTGARINAIKTQQGGNVQEINLEVFRLWINGEGRRPVSWETLITVLEDIDLNYLADKIKEHT